MNRTGYIWPIERVDDAGEPSPSGDYIKVGLRHAGELSAIWLDLLDAEALAAGLSALIAGKLPHGKGAPCNTCRKPLGPGDLVYRFGPGGQPALLCEACAPTVAEEDTAIARALVAGELPPGFDTRAQAATFRAILRVSHHAQTKRLAPLTEAATVEFPEPPPTARETYRGPPDE
jgi:hypothetical protein